jgi:hypothetical protein
LSVLAGVVAIAIASPAAAGVLAVMAVLWFALRR